MKGTPISVFDHALSFLSYREHGTKELATKLKNKGYPEEDIAKTLERLQDMNYLNDQRFADIFVRSRISKPLGVIRIMQELGQKGINSDIAKHAIEEADVDWFELAKQLKERRFGEEIETDYKEKVKQFRYLQYRGFDFEQIKYAVS
ncbi:regulatory protein RecX [Marinomonas sp. IMCC 4694]|uniref:regulatory protein RecX n=1 Tax=Marinomonas sp. IMCC 4694 TaxID=2605432 RepID=UPI0011E734FF|nr:regulatory protein RecX [Marinomonas sp. IMCC 4694]TYL48674.1 regulatory protein RecX [Marinomonas sp. IMCC 4694]